MLGVSNYVSLAVNLLITFMLTYSLANNIAEIAGNVENTIMNEDSSTCLSVEVINSTKYAVIDLGCAGEIIVIDGNYTVFVNSTDLLIIQTSLDEVVKIVTESDVYVI